MGALALESKAVVKEKMESRELNLGPQSEPRMLLTMSYPSKPPNSTLQPSLW